MEGDNSGALPGATVLKKTYTLLFPDLLDADGITKKRIESVTLRRPRGKELRALDAGGGRMAQTIALIAACAGVLPAEVDLMDGADVMNLAGFVSAFLGVSLPTGGT